MYSLDCSYYSKTFDSVNDLVNDVIQSGMDPNYEITHISHFTLFLFGMHFQLRVCSP